MLATTLIYLSGLGLCILAGVAIIALVEPRGRWLTPATPAAGAAFIVVLAFVFGFLLPGATAAVLVCVAIAALLALAAWRRRPWREELRAALVPSGGELLALALGAAAGMLLLIPVLSLGFPTTIAAGIADGWARSVLSEWLLDHALIDSSAGVAIDRPIGSYSSLPHELGAGYEYLIALVSTVTGRPTYQTALAVAALAAPISLGGWAALQAVITRRRTEVWQALVLAVATVSPAFVLPFVENYLTQFVSVSLWPFAMAATAAFLLRPAIGTAALGAIGLGALAGVYPPLAPWFAPPALLLVLACARHAPAALARRVPRPLRWAAPALAALAGLGLALVVIAPVELARAYESVVLFSGLLNSNAAFPLFQGEQDLAIVLGGGSQFTLTQGQTTGEVVAVLVLLLGAAAVGATAVWTMAREERRPVLALGAGVGGITLVLYLKYKFGDDYGYGAYKTLLSGGALLAGLLMLALASPSARWRSARLVAAGVCLAVWVPVSTHILQNQRDGSQGFRESDNALIYELDRLPHDDVVLVEGVAENPSSFQLRMTTSYATAAFGLRVDGLGSTFSYLSGGASPAWRPRRPWRWIVGSDAPSAFPVHRKTVWERPPYRVQDAPALDVTPYALAPPPALGAGPRSRFWMTPPPGSPPSDFIAGPVELIVGNRSPQAVEATLDVGLRTLQGRRSVEIATAGGPPRQVRLTADEKRVRYRVSVPAGRTARVTLDPGAPVVGAGGTLTPLLALTRVEVG